MAVIAPYDARMTRSLSINEPTGYPEFGVRREAIARYFDPPLANSTFHDLVNKGKIIPMKGIRGFYLLNASLRRLGLREVPSPGKEASSINMETQITTNAWRRVELISGIELHIRIDSPKSKTLDIPKCLEVAEEELLKFDASDPEAFARRTHSGDE